jgi:hypothetical protein
VYRASHGVGAAGQGPRECADRSSVCLAGVAQLAEHQLPKLRVAGSNPVSRSSIGAPWCNWQHA